jgi:hypothetical protein
MMFSACACGMKRDSLRVKAENRFVMLQVLHQRRGASPLPLRGVLRQARLPPLGELHLQHLVSVLPFLHLLGQFQEVTAHNGREISTRTNCGWSVRHAPPVPFLGSLLLYTLTRLIVLRHHLHCQPFFAATFNVSFHNLFIYESWKEHRIHLAH